MNYLKWKKMVDKLKLFDLLGMFFKKFGKIKFTLLNLFK